MYNGPIVAVENVECLKSEDLELAAAANKFVASITEARKDSSSRVCTAKRPKD
jgi:hypothetical protein